MPYDAVTPGAFKAVKPQFAAVDDVTVQGYLDAAGLWVDTSWLEACYQAAVIALACHMMTAAGLGSDGASQAFSGGAGIFQTIKSGELTLTRAAVPGGQDDYRSWINSTPCGQYFWLLAKANRAGPRVIMAGIAPCSSSYAKDWPAPVYGWPGVFS